MMRWARLFTLFWAFGAFAGPGPASMPRGDSGILKKTGGFRITAVAEEIRALRQAIFEAEDGRVLTADSVKVLTGAVRHPDAGIQRMAVRAIGRLERPEFVGVAEILLSSADASVRAEAVNALGQSLHALRSAGGSQNYHGGLAATVAAQLSARLADERDPMVRGVFGRTIGRLPYQDAAAVSRAEESLLAIAGPAADPADPDRLPAVWGAAKGFESLYRLNAKTALPSPAAVARLRALALERPASSWDPSTVEIAAQIRRLALMALTAAKRLDDALIEAAASDPDDQVRRLAFSALGAMPSGSIPGPASDRLLFRGLQDASAMVRYEALRLYGRTKRPDDPAPVFAAVGDKSLHVALLAVDLLGQSGAGSEKAVDVLKRLAGRPISSGSAEDRYPVAATWHAAAHALVALAKVAPDSAREFLPAFAADSAWPVRMYAARAAGILKDIAGLERLAADSHDNVREAALSGLVALKGHAADDLLISALGRPDYQLILTAVRALKGSSSAAQTVPALLTTLARLTTQKRDTSRDPRLAIIDRIGELGSAVNASALTPYAEDFDPRVAESAAAVVERWTGRKPAVRPRPLPVKLARLEDVERLSSATVRITMAGNGVFELRLLTDEAPATVARFVDLARAGYYNGLTFHRVVPNFLIQGGSPGANEYMGDGPYLRDEVGLESHLRGAVGISTRGRDTGDAQICPDVCDNVRLDHDYTVFARVTSGMDVVDRVLECDVIERIEIDDQAKTRMKTMTKMATDSMIPRAIK